MYYSDIYFNNLFATLGQLSALIMIATPYLNYYFSREASSENNNDSETSSENDDSETSSENNEELSLD